MQKKFSYPLKISELNQREYIFDIAADEGEREDIKDILQVEGVQSFVARVHLKLNMREHIMRVWGKVNAVLELQSVVSLRNFMKEYSSEFNLIYDTVATYKDIREMETGINDEVPDIIENGQVDIADIVLEQIALQLEDYPRMSGEKFEFSDYKNSNDDFEAEKKANPFAVLEKLKK